jgi:crossover junction endodeoxyribonuclease RuvC
MTTRSLIVGIDPGLSGALAVIEGGVVVLLADLPVVRFSDARIKNRIDAASLARLLEPYAGAVHAAVVEKVGARPGEAASGAFSFGYTSGCIAGVLGALNMPTTPVMPAVWKKALGLTSASKDASRGRALELFPSLADQLARKKDHDRAEAVLLAEYGRRHLTW